MNTDQRHSMFTLLYAMVLIDRRVLRIEVDQFFIAIEDFLERVDFIDSLKAKALISNWFVQHYKNILAEMKSPNLEHFLLRHVETLRFYEHRVVIYEMMQQIAHADNDFHNLEKEFLEKVAELWEC